MAGPWFTVQTKDDKWKQLDKIWISNGQSNAVGIVQMHLELEDPLDVNKTAKAY